MFEDTLATTQISADGEWMLLTAIDGKQKLLSLPSGTPAPEDLSAGLKDFKRAVLCGSRVARLASSHSKPEWTVDGRVLSVPGTASPVCSSDGQRLAYIDPSAPGTIGLDSPIAIDGVATHALFSPDGKTLFVLARRDSGLSAVYSISTQSKTVSTLAEALDAAPRRGNTFAVSPAQDALIVPLASAGQPKAADRQKPRSDRWLKLYRLDLNTHALDLIESRDDEDQIDPFVIGKKLFWTSLRVTKSVGLMSAQGGKVRLIVQGIHGYMPNWSADGRAIL